MTLNHSRPVAVYLDSQDFSNLAEPPPGKADFFAELDEKLSSLVASKAIEIRFSAAHISEISHTSMTAAAHSAKRAAVLNKLCAGKCLSFWIDILNDEITSAIVPSHPIKSLREDNEWIDINLSSLGNFAARLKQSLLDELKQKGFNRKARRRAAKADLVRMITKTQGRLDALDNVVERLNNAFPVEKEIDRQTLADYIAGEIGERKFFDYMKGILVDPVTLITKLALRFDQPLKLPALVRDQGDRLVSSINPTMERGFHLLKGLPTGAIFQTIRDDAKLMPVKVGLTVKRRIIREQISDLREMGYDLPVELSDETIEKIPTPTLDILTGLFAKHLSEMVSASASGQQFRPFQRSDGGDLFHATYVPYVDIFRCDTAWADRLKPFGNAYQTEIVARIDDLIPAIERKL